MRHDLNLHASTRRGRYRPAHAWLDRPGNGPIIRQRRSSGLRRRFGGRELRILAIALLLGIIAWGQVIGSRTPSVAAGQPASLAGDATGDPGH
jgi:hypothetical protein